MPKFSLKYVVINSRWNFQTMVPGLPVPGTTFFASLIKQLQPYGINPESVLVEAPTSSLADFQIRISLLRRTVNITLTYGWLEFIATNPDEEEIVALLSIIAALFSVLREIDTEVDKGNGRTSISMHMQFRDTSLDEFLNKYLIGSNQSPKLVPDAFAYSLNLSDVPIFQFTRVVFARSSVYENAAFTDLVYEYGGHEPGDTSDALNQIHSQYTQIFDLFDLQREEDEGAEEN